MTPAEFAILREMVKTDEGLRVKPYLDTVGKTTIGYGRNLTDNGITTAEAAMMLDHDLEMTVAQLTLAHPDVLNLAPARQIALANMAFNVGVAGIGGFHQMWAAIDRGAFETAAVEMLDSHWAQQVGPRATRLAEMMRSAEIKDPPIAIPLWTKGPQP
jgi:lysozyme